jgi:hypothetical protein
MGVWERSGSPKVRAGGCDLLLDDWESSRLPSFLAGMRIEAMFAFARRKMPKTDVDPGGTDTLHRSHQAQVVFLGDAPKLVSTTRNISHKKIMSVLEGTELVSAGADRCVLRPRWFVRCA